MTPKQKELLEHIYMNGGEDVSGFSNRVVSNCHAKEWIKLESDGRWQEQFNEFSFTITDAGRRALHGG